MTASFTRPQFAAEQQTVSVRFPFPKWSPLHILFNDVVADERGNVLETIAEIAKRRTPMHAIFLGVHVGKKFLGVN